MDCTCFYLKFKIIIGFSVNLHNFFKAVIMKFYKKNIICAKNYSFNLKNIVLTYKSKIISGINKFL